MGCCFFRLNFAYSRPSYSLDKNFFWIGVYMSHKCSFSNVGRQNGNRVSHANNKTHHVFLANLQARRVYIPSQKKYVRVKLSTRMLRTIDKLGIEATLRKFNVNLADLTA